MTDDIETLLQDKERVDRAFNWVDVAIGRQESALDAVVFPALAPGVFVTDLNVCQDYSCNCGWNITVSGRDMERRARLTALAERPEDERYGAFKILGAHDGKLWTVKLAGNDSYGLDALISLLL